MHLNTENKFFSFMSLLGDLIFLNLLFLLTSIPLLTIGASFCALYSTINKRILGRESYIAKDYMRAWKNNLKNALCIQTLLMIPIAGMLIFTMYIASHTASLPAVILYSFFFIVIAFILLYAFPLQATFVNTPLRIIRNSLLTALRHLPWTFALFFTTYTPPSLTFLFPEVIYFTGAYWILIGFSLSTVCSVLITTKKIFVFYMPQETSSPL